MTFVLPPRNDAARQAAIEPDIVREAEPSQSRGRTGVRGVFDGLACLAIAVLVLRSFLVEGYMISTGSMAPALLGYHKRIVCPTCGADFAHGVAFDDSMTPHDADASLLGAGTHAVCPNCGESSIAISQVPRNHGDQLLVMKHAFDFRPPRRWEIAVFHNPSHPMQAFVKRVVGLPGEAVQIIDGDVYANGEICRKSLEMQRAMRIPVFESTHVPPNPGPGDSHWRAAAGWTTGPIPGQFQFDHSDEVSMPVGTGESAWSWLGYRHRSSMAAERVTAVPVTNLPLGFALPDSPFIQPVQFRADSREPDSGTLSVRGPLEEEWEKRLRDLSATASFQAAIDRLAAESRHPAITDEYGYNDLREGGRNAVTDLMISGMVRLTGEGEFAVEMRDDQRRFRVVIDTREKTISLIRAETGARLRSGPLPAAVAAGETVLLEMSVMDRQVLVAIDGVRPFPPWTYEAGDPLPPDGKPPVRLGARGLSADVRELILYRDVYYTPGRRRNGITEPYALGREEFFVLGDNSPVSLDSRSWTDGTVPAKLLVGKPFVVHLPSRPATLRIGSRQFTVRVPDFGRMRYIE